MMKKFILLAFAMIAFLTTNAQTPQSVPLAFSMERVKTYPTGKPNPRSPLTPPYVEMDDHTLYFETGHAAFTLVLLDEDGEEAYEVSVPNTVDVLVLPSTLVGNYELQLYDGSEYYFYCDIVLE